MPQMNLSSSEHRSLRDSDLLDNLMHPHHQAAYRSHPRAHARLDTSLRAYWHNLFDPCPALLKVADADGLEIFRPFMQWAQERCLSMNWTLHLGLYEWLRQSPFASCLNNELSDALMAACAARWAIIDRSDNAGLALGQRGNPAWLIGWKCRQIDGGRQITRVELAVALPEPPNDFAYFLLPTFESDDFPGWREIPY
jgi:uncharacterized repeat protein (TIGR04061 family)